MSLILLDGCEDFSSWAVAGSPTIVAGRNGNGFSLANSGITATFSIPTADQTDTLTIGVAIKPTAVPTNAGNGLIQFRSDTGVTTHVSLNGLGTAQGFGGYRGASAILLISGIAPWTPGAWHYVEFQAKMHDTTGTMAIRVNGVLVASGTALDTRNAGTKAVFDQVTLNGISGGATIFDDLWISNDTTFLGDMAIETLYPNGNGNANQWVGSDTDSVNNYLLVDEAGTPVITDYVGSSTSGQQDMYAMTDLTRTTGTVLAVCHQAYAAKADSGARQFKIVNRRTADTKSAALDLTASYAPYHYTLATDPDAAGAWTIANVNALQSGVEVV